MNRLGFDIVISNVLPIIPSPGEDARRIVRHGLADVLDWLGEDVGPSPGMPTHALMVGDTLHVSPDLYERLS